MSSSGRLRGGAGSAAGEGLRVCALLARLTSVLMQGMSAQTRDAARGELQSAAAICWRYAGRPRRFSVGAAAGRAVFVMGVPEELPVGFPKALQHSELSVNSLFTDSFGIWVTRTPMPSKHPV